MAQSVARKGALVERMNLHQNAANGPTSRSLPGGIETEMREHLMAKLGQMRVAPVAWIRPGVHDFRLDVCWALAEHDNPAGKEQRLFHIVGHEQRGEASALPQ